MENLLDMENTEKSLSYNENKGGCGHPASQEGVRDKIDNPTPKYIIN